MKKMVRLFLFCACVLSSCASVKTKTYDLVDSYSDLANDPLRTAMDKKIKDFLWLADYWNKPKFNKYVLNGRYLTIKIKQKEDEKIGHLMRVTLCKQDPLTNCTDCD